MITKDDCLGNNLRIKNPAEDTIKTAADEPANNYAADELLSGGKQIIDATKTVTKTAADSTVDKMMKLRDLRKQRQETKTDDNTILGGDADGTKADTGLPKSKKNLTIVVKKRSGKKKYQGKKKDALPNLRTKENEKAKSNNTDSLAAGMESLKADYAIKSLTGGAAKGTKKTLNLLLKLIKKVLKLLIIKFGLIIIPVVIIAIIGGGFYNSFIRESSELKKNIKKAFGEKVGDDYFEFADGFDEELLIVQGNMKSVTDYHSNKLQTLINSHKGKYDVVDFSAAEPDWEKFKNMYINLVANGRCDGIIDTQKDIKGQLLSLYDASVILKSEITTEINPSDKKTQRKLVITHTLMDYK